MTENPLCSRHGLCFSEVPPRWIYSTAVGKPLCHFAGGEAKTLKSVRLIQGHPTWNQNSKYLFISKGRGSLRVFWPHKYQVFKIWEFPTPWVPGGQDRAVWAVEIPRQRQLHPGPCICQREDPNVWAIKVGQRESTGPRVCHSLVPGAHCASPPWFWNRLSSEGDLTKPLAWWGFWEILSWRNLLHSG